MSDKFIPLVDQHSQVIGYAEKLYAHKNPLLHLAFSLMVYRSHNDQVEFLLQKRAQSKYHCPGLWANTCCSHPKSYQSIVADVKRRLEEELGLNIDLEDIRYIDKFIYKEPCGQDLCEYEYDYVFVAKYNPDRQFKLNPQEVEELQWQSFSQLEKTMLETYSVPWLKYIVKILKENTSKLV